MCTVRKRMLGFHKFETMECRRFDKYSNLCVHCTGCLYNCQSIYMYHKVLILYIGQHSVSVPSSELGLPQPLSRKRVCPLTGPKGGGGAHTPTAKGVGEFQFWRLEKKLSTLPTLWYVCTISVFCTIHTVYRDVKNWTHCFTLIYCNIMSSVVGTFF